MKALVTVLTASSLVFASCGHPNSQKTGDVPSADVQQTGIEAVLIVVSVAGALYHMGNIVSCDWSLRRVNTYVRENRPVACDTIANINATCPEANLSFRGCVDPE